MGSAVAYHATQLGLRVLGLDRFDPPHDLGSTKAETRITRLAVGEGPQYIPFVRRSHELWRELEARAGVELLHECGGFIITEQQPVAGQRWEDFVVETARRAADAQIPYDVMEPEDVRAAYPWLTVPNARRVGYEPTAGLVMAERCVSVQLDLARSGGATLHMNEPVVTIDAGPDMVQVATEQGAYRAERLVLATGPWFRELAAPEFAEQVTVTRQVVYWFEVEDLAAYSTTEIPFIMWIAEKDEDYIALCPIPPGGTPAVRMLGEQFLETTDPETVNREVKQNEIDHFYDVHVAPKFTGISRNCVRTAVCLYSNTPDDHFLIDTDPRSDRITVMSPCSGHGFKHSTAVGEAVAQRVATGKSDLDLEPFRSRS
jgi:sarcosine oxidase